MKQLGKLPPKQDSRTLKFINYLPKRALTYPSTVRWDTIKNQHEWGMDGNDRYGNCVIVTAAHIIDCAKANELGHYQRIEDDDVIRLSQNWNATNGYYVLNRLKKWLNIGMFGTKIIAFCELDKQDHRDIRAAINIFGHVDVGLWMPKAWQDSEVWDTGNTADFEPGSWGGHSVPILGYHTYGTQIDYYACSWGKIYVITQRAMDRYCDEIYTSILPEWYAFDNITPSQFDVETLMDDIRMLS